MEKLPKQHLNNIEKFQEVEKIYEYEMTLSLTK